MFQSTHCYPFLGSSTWRWCGCICTLYKFHTQAFSKGIFWRRLIIHGGTALSPRTIGTPNTYNERIAIKCDALVCHPVSIPWETWGASEALGVVVDGSASIDCRLSSGYRSSENGGVRGGSPGGINIKIDAFGKSYCSIGHSMRLIY